MHRVVSTSTALSTIATLAFFVAVYTLTRNYSLNFPEENQALAVNNPSKKTTTSKEPGGLVEPVACKEHIFEGEAKIAVWEIVQDDKVILKVAAVDLDKLPFPEFDTFTLIDTTSEIDSQLAVSSEENPIKITISGFATSCDNSALACLSYKKGIFKDYLENKF